MRSAPARAWVENVVGRVEGTAQLVVATASGSKIRKVDVHIRIAADGAILNVEFGPPPDALDTRLREAVVAAGPFGRPPQALLAPDGMTDLNFTLDIPDRRR
ncbi:Energy transducer TonB [Methylorubrum aminovorans]